MLLLDPMLATGGSAIRAIQVLLDHGVKEENIVFLNLIATPEGIHALTARFPEVHIVTSEIDEGLNEVVRVLLAPRAVSHTSSPLQKFILPGIGDFGDRYFGTNN